MARQLLKCKRKDCFAHERKMGICLCLHEAAEREDGCAFYKKRSKKLNNDTINAAIEHYRAMHQGDSKNDKEAS